MAIDNLNARIMLISIIATRWPYWKHKCNNGQIEASTDPRVRQH